MREARRAPSEPLTATRPLPAWGHARSRHLTSVGPRTAASCVRLPSPSIVCSRSVHIVARVSASPLHGRDAPLCGQARCVCHFFIAGRAMNSEL